MFFYPLPPFFPLNISIFLFDSFFFFRVISDEKALSVSIACYLGQRLELKTNLCPHKFKLMGQP